MNVPMKHSVILAAALALAASVVRAENIDLSTVPERDTVQLTIYNSEDLTLVRETRKVSFKPGVNPLQFSWANTLIDPTSVELRFLTHPERLSLLDTTFPNAKPQMLYWNVESDFDGEAMVEISYFTSGIHWSADYIGIAEADETRLKLEGFVRVDNGSGEEYENAQVRLVVGRINLVQKIAELAQAMGKDLSKLADDESRAMKLGVVRDLIREKDAKGAFGERAGRSGQRQGDAPGPEGSGEGRSGGVFHLHDRGHGDDPQRLGQAAAEPAGGRRAAKDPVPLPPRRIRRSTGADVSVDQ